MNQIDHFFDKHDKGPSPVLPVHRAVSPDLWAATSTIARADTPALERSIRALLLELKDRRAAELESNEEVV